MGTASKSRVRKAEVISVSYDGAGASFENVNKVNKFGKLETAIDVLPGKRGLVP
jgi:hypothetical protein